MLFKRIVIIHTQDLGSRTESNLYAHMLMLDTHGVPKKGDLSSDLELILRLEILLLLFGAYFSHI